jgi:DNA-binding NarL/FixJ family response regulator
MAGGFGPILIADGVESSRQLIADVLSNAGYTARAFPSGEALLAAAREEEPAAVVLAVALPGLTGYDICRWLRGQFGELLPIILVSTARGNPLDCVAGLLLGADDFVATPFEPAELLARVGRSVTRAAAIRSPRRFVAHDLTRRELHVLSLLADGLTQTAIADQLVISPATVGTHIQRILGKLDVHSRAEAVAFAHRHGLTEAVERQLVAAGAA